MHLSTDIGKTSTPLPSFPEQSSILSKMGRNESFLATTLLGGVGGGGGGTKGRTQSQTKNCH